MADQYELITRSEAMDPFSDKVLSNSNVIEAQSTMTMNPLFNLKFLKNIEEHPIRFVIAAVVTTIVLSVSITCIVVFGINRKPIEAQMTTQNITATAVSTTEATFTSVTTTIITTSKVVLGESMEILPRFGKVFSYRIFCAHSTGMQ